MTTSHFKRSSPDLKCTSQSSGGQPSMCNTMEWSNPEWLNEEFPEFTREGAVVKDTISVPAGGYVVVRYKADNPG